jgi:hypothetical protein
MASISELCRNALIARQPVALRQTQNGTSLTRLTGAGNQHNLTNLHPSRLDTRCYKFWVLIIR